MKARNRARPRYPFRPAPHCHVCLHGTPLYWLLPASLKRLIPACPRNTSPSTRSPAISKAYPCLREERATNSVRYLRSDGSSPRARGTHIKCLSQHRVSRLIPAREGNARGGWRPRHARRAHPRLRGEHTLRTDRSFWQKGSSPLERGTPGAGAKSDGPGGLIPACAGTLWVPSIHPPKGGGSSPLARGTQFLLHGLHESVGLIPACAGNTTCHTDPDTAAKAHPRLRGEHLGGAVLTMLQAGSSPLARGTLAIRAELQNVGRLIPACAGNTGPAGPVDPLGPAHPRLRGEHGLGSLTRLKLVGSSPLARGTRARGLRRRPRVRLIPACAGNTYETGTQRRRAKAHPHLRGEHVKNHHHQQKHRGPSPLARGTPGRLSGNPLNTGLIPACAGNTFVVRLVKGGARAHPRLRGEHTSRAAKTRANFLYYIRLHAPKT